MALLAVSLAIGSGCAVDGASEREVTSQGSQPLETDITIKDPFGPSYYDSDNGDAPRVAGVRTKCSDSGCSTACQIEAIDECFGEHSLWERTAVNWGPFASPCGRNVCCSTTSAVPHDCQQECGNDYGVCLRDPADDVPETLPDGTTVVHHPARCHCSGSRADTDNGDNPLVGGCVMDYKDHQCNVRDKTKSYDLCGSDGDLLIEEVGTAACALNAPAPTTKYYSCRVYCEKRGYKDGGKCVTSTVALCGTQPVGHCECSGVAGDPDPDSSFRDTDGKDYHKGGVVYRHEVPMCGGPSKLLAIDSCKDATTLLEREVEYLMGGVPSGWGAACAEWPKTETFDCDKWCKDLYPTPKGGADWTTGRGACVIDPKDVVFVGTLPVFPARCSYCQAFALDDDGGDAPSTGGCVRPYINAGCTSAFDAGEIIADKCFGDSVWEAIGPATCSLSGRWDVKQEFRDCKTRCPPGKTGKCVEVVTEVCGTVGECRCE